ncbi:MAG: hypothetical protein AB7F89_18175, partial [Pirellulaceae bacterium]
MLTTPPAFLRRILCEGCVAWCAIALAVLGRWLLTPLVGDAVPLLSFFPAIFIVAWWGGMRPTIWALLAFLLVIQVPALL